MAACEAEATDRGRHWIRYMPTHTRARWMTEDIVDRGLLFRLDTWQRGRQGSHELDVGRREAGVVGDPMLPSPSRSPSAYGSIGTGRRSNSTGADTRGSSNS